MPLEINPFLQKYLPGVLDLLPPAELRAQQEAEALSTLPVSYLRSITAIGSLSSHNSRLLIRVNHINPYIRYYVGRNHLR